jgi:hypothetical protein
MRTLYLRNVPDEVVERLERLAERESTSVNAIAVRQLSESTRWLDNAALLASLPSYGVSAKEIVEEIERGRAERDAGH